KQGFTGTCLVGLGRETLHIDRHRVAVEAGIESAQCVEEALRRFEGLRLDREARRRYLVVLASNVPAGFSTLGLREPPLRRAASTLVTRFSAPRTPQISRVRSMF